MRIDAAKRDMDRLLILLLLTALVVSAFFVCTPVDTGVQ